MAGADHAAEVLGGDFGEVHGCHADGYTRVETRDEATDEEGRAAVHRDADPRYDCTRGAENALEEESGSSERDSNNILAICCTDYNQKFTSGLLLTPPFPALGKIHATGVNMPTTWHLQAPKMTPPPAYRSSDT